MSATLEDGSRIGIIGGGPAGSLFAHLLLALAERVGLELAVDIFEPKDFSRPGPAGCNRCGGVVSESLVQALAAEGIILPPSVIRRGIDSYILHMDAGSVTIATPHHERRIGAVHRGAGPLDLDQSKWRSFDGHLLELAVERGARHRMEQVRALDWDDGRPRLTPREGTASTYDLVAVAVGVNTTSLRLFEGPLPAFRPPPTVKTFIREYYLGEDLISRTVGSAMHVFLLDLPRLEFAAIIPKGDYATVVLLGDHIDDDLVRAFLATPEVGRCLPPDLDIDGRSCQCAPRIAVGGAVEPYADRLVFIGDCGESRLYKDGIGAAYRTAKAATKTAVFEGVARADFARHYRPVCTAIRRDNRIGKLIFSMTRLLQMSRIPRRAILDMVTGEQARDRPEQAMSMILWDTFTGSAPYTDILRRAMAPAFAARFGRHLAGAVLPRRDGSTTPRTLRGGLSDVE